MNLLGTMHHMLYYEATTRCVNTWLLAISIDMIIRSFHDVEHCYYKLEALIRKMDQKKKTAKNHYQIRKSLFKIYESKIIAMYKIL